ncbi:hypothetical protein [Leuconostoc citreum]|uniref:hypothetical protein n=1 Tax=Leuconostoc citreum TaxID=33964 RepID=UPI00140AF72B|nr:hypothetical protein [Leuconostoc citreum]
MATFDGRGYNIGEIVDKEHLNMSRNTFDRHIRHDKTFPKPYISTGNTVMYWGTRIQY